MNWNAKLKFVLMVLAIVLSLHAVADQPKNFEHMMSKINSVKQIGDCQLFLKYLPRDVLNGIPFKATLAVAIRGSTQTFELDVTQVQPGINLHWREGESKPGRSDEREYGYATPHTHPRRNLVVQLDPSDKLVGVAVVQTLSGNYMNPRRKIYKVDVACGSKAGIQIDIKL